MLTALVATLLLLALSAAGAGPAFSWPYVAFGAIVVCIAIWLTLGFVRPARALEDSTAVARLVGLRHPALASDLLSAVELQADQTGAARVSGEMTRAFCAEVADATQPLSVEELFPLRRAVRALSLAAVALLVLLGGILIFPRAVGHGLRTLFHSPTLFEAARVSRDPLVGDVRITYDYPAYTGLPRQVVDGSTGDLYALRGTHVQIEMHSLRLARQARLILGENGEAGSIPAQLDHGKLTASLVLKDSGAYRVWLLPFLGRPVREQRAHRIVVEDDRPPEVDIVGPADRLVLATPRPVEVAYHARDDFGLAEISLVYRVNDGPDQRILLKKAQGVRDVRATTMFEPSSALLTPGARVAYHIEAKDRDEVSGSKVGVSRTLYLVIQNPRQDLEDHLVHEREILERFLACLADRIELEAAGDGGEAPSRVSRLREIHEHEQASLLALARFLAGHRREAGLGKALTSSLVTASARLDKRMREESEALAASSSKGQRGAGGLARLRSLDPRHIAELETTVLALDDLIGRQRLDDLAGIGADLMATQRRLQDLLARYKATGDEQLRRQIEREVRELRARITELARKIAEVKARDEVSPEWMNLPDTRKAMADAARLDALLAKGDAQSLDQALGELGHSLASLRQLLDKNAGDFANAQFPRENRALAELSRKLGELEGDQRRLADDSRALAKDVDGELARRVEAGQARFLAKAKQRLDQIQRKITSGVPRDLGGSGDTARQAVREHVSQLRQLLSAREWSEAQDAADRMVEGLGRLQHLTRRQLLQQRPHPQAMERFSGQVQDAAGLANELAADLARLIPRGADVMSADQKVRGQVLGQRQGSIAQKTRNLSRDLEKREDVLPRAEQAAGELQGIADEMRQAGRDLHQGSTHDGARSADEVAQRLAEMRQRMSQRPSAGARASREPVHIPGANAYQAPREWRQELMEAMREKVPERFRDQVRHYYEDLVR